MRAFFRLWMKFNQSFNRIGELTRVFIIVGSIFIGSMCTMASIMFGHGIWISVGPIVYVFIFVALGIFNFPVLFNKDWINTYKIGIPGPFPNRISVHYDLEAREEMIEWCRENFRFYRGTLKSDGKAKFKFLKKRDAAAFKLRWL